MSQSLDVRQSSAYCLATAIGARQTLAPLIADKSQIKPDSQSASRRHSSPNLRPYANKQLPITEMTNKKTMEKSKSKSFENEEIFINFMEFFFYQKVKTQTIA